MRALSLVAIFSTCAVSAFGAAEPLSGYDTWAGIPRHPAQVNPVCPGGRDVVSLRGEWDCALGRHGNGWRTWGLQYTNEWGLTGSLNVPGSWEAQGVGDEGMGLPHLCQDQAPKPLRHVYRGEVWYRKYVEIPGRWAGRRIWFKTGGFRSVGTVWVNDHPVARVANFCEAWKYDVTPFVTPGETAKIVMSVDNAVSPRNAQMDGANRWGGVWRDIELEATPSDCWIDDCWVRGLFDERAAEVHVAVDAAGSSKPPCQIRVTIDGSTISQPLKPLTPPKLLKLPLRDFRPWSPESPNLYTAKVELVDADGRVLQSALERFGVRKLEVRGKEFYLNDRPFFVRGFGDDSVYPLTGLSPADRDFHREHLGKARRAGFNFVRLHTHTETEEYFDAADECGILVQPELSYYMDNAEDDFLFDPLSDVKEMHLACRRHPSFGFYSCGNEGSVGPFAGKAVGEWVRANDPDRLFVEQDGGSYLHEGHGEGRMTHASGPLKPWERGSFNPRAFICHEYLNLCVKCDSRDEPLYTGVWKPPVTRAERGWWLRQHGLDQEWGDRLQSSQHALQKFWFKQGIESARMDPYCDGYCLWTIADVVVRNAKASTYSAQGLFNPFWQEKRGGVTADEFAAFNSASAILLDNEGKGDRAYRENASRLLCNSPWSIEADREGTNRVYVSGEAIPADFILAHFGVGDLDDAVLEWSLSSGDVVLASGRRGLGRQKCGPSRLVARERIVVPEIGASARAVLAATVSSSDYRISNAWTFYLFPRRKARSIAGLAAADGIYDAIAARYPGICRFQGIQASGRPGGRASSLSILVCRDGSPEHLAARAAGVRTVALSNQSGEPNIALGWWQIGAQAGTAFVAHPVFRHLPFEEHLTPLYFRILKEGTPLGVMRGGTNVMPAANVRAADIIAAGEGGEQCYFYLAETRSRGSVDGIRISGLDVLSDTPEGAALLDGVLDYLQTSAK